MDEIFKNIMDTIGEEKEDNSEATLLTNKAIQALNNGDVNNAIDNVQNALKTDPYHVNANILMGNLFEVAKRDKEALALYEKVAKKHPNNPNPILEITKFHLKRGDEKKGLKILEKGNADLKDNYEILLLLGVLYASKKKKKKSIELLEKAYTLNPKGRLLLYNLGKVCLDTGDINKAVKYFLEYYDITPSNEVKSDEEQILGGLVSYLMNNKRFEDASKFLKKLTDLFPKNKMWWMTLAFCNGEMNRLDLAVEPFEKVLELDPNEEIPLDALRIGYALQKNYEKELGVIKKILLQSPGNLGYYERMGQLYNLMKKYDEAEETLLKYLDKNPDDTDVLYHLADAHIGRKQFDKATEIMGKILKLKPNDADELNEIGWLYGKMENFDKALELCKKAIELKPNAAHIHHSVGWINRKLKNYEEAIKSFKISADLDKTRADAWYDLAFIYYDQQDYKLANEAFQKVLDIGINSVGEFDKELFEKAFSETKNKLG